MRPEAGASAIDAHAVNWLVRQRDPTFAEWEAFGEWLAADPAHAEAYQQAAVDLQQIDEILTPAPASAPPVTPAGPVFGRAEKSSRRGVWCWAGGAAVAATLVGGTLMLAPRAPERRLYLVETRIGQHREVRIDGSASVALNGGTRISLDHDDPRYAALERGQAVFDIVHDPSRPFELEVAGSRLVDVGTRFEVVREADGFDLGVAEGEVRYERGAERRPVAKGERLIVRGGEAREARIAPATVGSWTGGRLIYDGASMSRVAADLSRSLGVVVAVRPSASGRSFSGVIILDGGAERVMPDLGPLLGVAVRRTSAGWEISP